MSEGKRGGAYDFDIAFSWLFFLTCSSFFVLSLNNDYIIYLSWENRFRPTLVLIFSGVWEGRQHVLLYIREQEDQSTA